MSNLLFYFDTGLDRTTYEVNLYVNEKMNYLIFFVVGVFGHLPEGSHSLSTPTGYCSDYAPD